MTKRCLRMHRQILAVCAISLAVFGAGGCDPKGMFEVTPSLMGTVYDSRTGSGIGGAAVTVQGKTEITFSSGGFIISDLDAGATTVAVKKDGYKDFVGVVEIGEGFTSHDVGLEPN